MFSEYLIGGRSKELSLFRFPRLLPQLGVMLAQLYYDRSTFVIHATCDYLICILEGI